MADKSTKTANWQRRTDHSILLVDDNTDVLVATGAFLTKEGFSVQMSTNGDEALRLIANATAPCPPSCPPPCPVADTSSVGWRSPRSRQR